jgi:hypothetical protein
VKARKFVVEANLELPEELREELGKWGLRLESLAAAIMRVAVVPLVVCME